MLSIVIPVYNEEGSLATLVTSIKKTMGDLGSEFEVIFVNDGSSDRSAEKLNEIANVDQRFKVIHFVRNFGQTSAMMAGIDHSKGDIIIPMDADLQNDPADIPRLLEKLDEGFDVCSGWRSDRKDAAISRNLPSKIANKIISFISGVHLHDYGCSLKAYRRKVIKGVKLYGEMHRFIPIYASWMGGKVTEIPVIHHARIHGESKYGINRTFKVIVDLIFIRFMAKNFEKPIHFFGGFGLLNLSLSGITFIWMLALKIFWGTAFSITPLPMLIVLFFLVGIQSIFFGLLAEIQMRTYYESQDKSAYQIEDTQNLEQ
ncbi:MAG: glycosyltransferase involved in cell wall biosynthesis [Candidatus Azotimanducaceae bacterium]